MIIVVYLLMILSMLKRVKWKLIFKGNWLLFQQIGNIRGNVLGCLGLLLGFGCLKRHCVSTTAFSTGFVDQITKAFYLKN